jgi:hypothetical protein
MNITTLDTTVDTIHGNMRTAFLDRVDAHMEYPEAVVDATEYWLVGEMVHRSASIRLKGKPLGASQAEIR